MSERSDKRVFASRSADPDTWIKAADVQPARTQDVSVFTARLTIDITPELRGHMKIVAIQRGLTVTDMLRELLAREFPSTSGEPT